MMAKRVVLTNRCCCRAERFVFVARVLLFEIALCIGGRAGIFIVIQCFGLVANGLVVLC